MFSRALYWCFTNSICCIQLSPNIRNDAFSPIEDCSPYKCFLSFSRTCVQSYDLFLTSSCRLGCRCAMGNCYSLQKDHETALKNFQRAVQLNSKFTYAHTLCGHEYVTAFYSFHYLTYENETLLKAYTVFWWFWPFTRYVALDDFENGIKSYQSALRLDARHYNSWFGLGMIYFRQEKFEFAEHHFRMANQINPCSSVIASNLGTALHALKVPLPISLLKLHLQEVLLLCTN